LRWLENQLMPFHGKMKIPKEMADEIIDMEM